MGTLVATDFSFPSIAMTGSENSDDLKNLSVRKIALLISSVDASTGQQLMLQLPSHVANEVRGLLPGIRSDAAECAEIIAEIQKHASFAESCQSTPIQAGYFESNRSAIQSIPLEALNTQFSAKTISQILADERPAIQAVLINQLPPERSIEVLKDLGAELSSRIVCKIADLSDITAEVRDEIQTYLSEKLLEYQIHAQNEENSERRLENLLSSASTELREHWTSTIQAFDLASVSSPANGQVAPACDHDTHNELSAEACTADAPSSQQPFQQTVDDRQSLPMTDVATNDRNAFDDRTFESLLNLPTETLRQLFDPIVSETVLLALAGASPDFLRGLQEILDASQVADLKEASKRLGPIKICDIDEAQSRVLTRANQLLNDSSQLRAA